MIPRSLLDAIAALINRALASDPAAMPVLEKMQGRRIAVHCSRPLVQLELRLNPAGVELVAGDQLTPADVTLTGELAALVRLGTTAARGESDFSNSGVQIQGDVGLLLQLSRTLAQLDIDWEFLLGQLVGETPARFLFMGLEQGAAYRPMVRDQLMKVGSDLAENHLRLASQPNLEQLRSEARQLVFRLDRLQARVERLSPTLGETL